MLWNDQNIGTFKELESAVMALWRREPGLSDHMVERAYEALHQDYDAEARGRRGRPHRLTGLDLAGYDAVRAAAEYLLGRAPRPASSPVETAPVAIGLVRDCLRELSRSVGRHQRTKGGPTGYLGHVAKYLPSVDVSGPKSVAGAGGSVGSDASASPPKD